ncbi:hypothetical protein [Pseudoalteromonas rubra]|nr:hypothetical protein [Pseudoalteromonas rubra]
MHKAMTQNALQAGSFARCVDGQVPGKNNSDLCSSYGRASRAHCIKS